MPLTWRKFIFLTAMGKAAVAGAGLGLAVLGALDFTFAITAQEWWHAFRPDAIMNAFAAGGAAVGIVSRIIAAVLA